MNSTIQTRKFRQKARGNRRVPVEHDQDWQYTGAIHCCKHCGHRIDFVRDEPELCLVCGAALALEDEGPGG